MPLFPCPACANPVSDQAQSCPKCGHPLRAAPPTPSLSGIGPPPRRSMSSGALIAVIAGALAVLLVPVLGIIAAIAIPNYLRFQARARQTEAKTSLKAIYVASKSRFAENGIAPSTFADLGFRPEPGHRYAYFYGDDVIGTAELPAGIESFVDAESGEFKAVAVGNLDGDPTLDVWTINHRNDLQNPVNDVNN